MDIPIFFIQLATLVVLVISAYKAYNFSKTKNWPDLFFNTAVAFLAFSFLF